MAQNKPKSVRTVRVNDAMWEAARKRAVSEKVSMSHVVNELVEGYAVKAFDLPTVEKVFSQTPPAK